MPYLLETKGSRRHHQRHREHIQTPRKGYSWRGGSNQESSCCEAAVLTTVMAAPTVEKVSQMHETTQILNLPVFHLPNAIL